MGIHDRENPLSKLIRVSDLNGTSQLQIVDGNYSSSDAESVNSIPPARRPQRRQRRPKTDCMEALDYSSLANRLQIKNRRTNQRLNNLSFLKDIVGLNEADIREEGEFCPEYGNSALASLFTEEAHMKAWNDFIELSEEQQSMIIYPRERNACINETIEEQSDEDDDFDKLNDSVEETTVDKRSVHPCYSAEACFERIEAHLKSALRKKTFPLGMIEWLEGELRQCFTDCAFSIYESPVENGYGRLLMHALCQYLGLVSMSYNHGDMRRLNVVNGSPTFNPPSQTLTEYLEQHAFIS